MVYSYLTIETHHHTIQSFEPLNAVNNASTPSFTLLVKALPGINIVQACRPVCLEVMSSLEAQRDSLRDVVPRVLPDSKSLTGNSLAYDTLLEILDCMMRCALVAGANTPRTLVSSQGERSEPTHGGPLYRNTKRYINVGLPTVGTTYHRYLLQNPRHQNKLHSDPLAHNAHRYRPDATLRS